MSKKPTGPLKIDNLVLAHLNAFRMKSPSQSAEGTCYLGDDNWLGTGDTICLNDEVWVCQSDGSLVKKDPPEFCT